MTKTNSHNSKTARQSGGYAGRLNKSPRFGGSFLGVDPSLRQALSMAAYASPSYTEAASGMEDHYKNGRKTPNHSLDDATMTGHAMDVGVYDSNNKLVPNGTFEPGAPAYTALGRAAYDALGTFAPDEQKNLRAGVNFNDQDSMHYDMRAFAGLGARNKKGELVHNIRAPGDDYSANRYLNAFAAQSAINNDIHPELANSLLSTDAPNYSMTAPDASLGMGAADMMSKDTFATMGAVPESAASRMWSGVAGVLGTSVDAAKSMVQQTGVPSLVNAVTQQAAQVAQASAQAQNPATPAPAAPTPATSLAHPQSVGAAPAGPVQKGPDLSSPIGRINAAAQAAGVQPSRPISATPDTARAMDPGVAGMSMQAPSMDAGIGPGFSESTAAAMTSPEGVAQQVANATAPGPAPGTVGVGKPGELGTPMAAPAPTAPAYSTPMDTPPTPKQIAAPVVAPRPVQQPMVQAPRPQLPSLPQVQQQPAAAAIASTPVNGLTSLANKPEQPMSKPQTESQIAHSLASQPGLMGALGMTSQSVNSPGSSGGAPSGGGLLSSIGGFMGGLLGNVGGLNSGNPMGIQSVNGSKTKSTLGGGDAHTAL